MDLDTVFGQKIFIVHSCKKINSSCREEWLRTKVIEELEQQVCRVHKRPLSDLNYVRRDPDMVSTLRNGADLASLSL